MVFSIGPQMFDIVFASIFIAWKLTPWVSVVVFVTLASYIPLTVVLTEWRGHFRRWDPTPPKTNHHPAACPMPCSRPALSACLWPNFPKQINIRAADPTNRMTPP